VRACEPLTEGEVSPQRLYDREARVKETIALPSGERVPALGQGTWHMGERADTIEREAAALRLGIDLGATLIDTAEMYGEGAAERLVGRVIAGRRSEVFLVSKVYPHHATGRGIAAACERSLKRLGTDRIDLYLLHWRGAVPLDQTIEGLDRLARDGKIRYYGVSNLDLNDMREWWVNPAGRAVAANQLLYNLTRRGIEWELVAWLLERRIPVMAYSPLEQGRLLRHPSLISFAQRHGMSRAHVALSWLLAKGAIVIPKSGCPERVKENIGALEVRLSSHALAELDELFPPPAGPRPLEML
jgi:diketogulonate reductase-like aldo/keto reductase